MYYKIIISITLFIFAFWNAKNIGPQGEAGAIDAAIKSMIMSIGLFIIALMILKSPWCTCYFLEY